MTIRRTGLLLTLLVTAASMVVAQEATGHLVIIGGGDRVAPIMGKIVELAGGPNAVIVLLPMASSYADSADYERELTEEFTGYGVKEFRFLNIKRAMANDPATIAKFDGVTGVFFGGGDQAVLTAAIGGTAVERRIHELYRKGAVISGTSAGAAVMSSIMITGEQMRPTRDSSFNKIEAGYVETKLGFGFVPDVIIDQHFAYRRRHNRLLSLVVEHPDHPGVAIDEATAIWVKPDRTFEVIGASCVIIYDATAARTVRDAEGYGLRASGIRTHILRSGAQYDLKSRSVIRLEP